MKKFTGTFASLAVITALATPAFAQAPQPSTTPMPTQSTHGQPEEQSPSTAQPHDKATKTDLSTHQDKSHDDKSHGAKMVTGELVKVDSDLMELTIKSADDQHHTFRYADSTKVDGADEQVSGLATRAGQLVTVHYTEGAGDSRIATKVKFDKK